MTSRAKMFFDRGDQFYRPYACPLPESIRQNLFADAYRDFHPPEHHTHHRPHHRHWRHHYKRHHGHVHRHLDNHQGHGEYTYDGAKGGDRHTQIQNAKIVGQVAKEMGVDPATAVAAMLVESRGNHRAVGDRGTSFGLFQLHRGGMLGNLSPEQACNPVLNARVALSEFKKHQYQCSSPGDLAATSQRPANRRAYACAVNAALPEARRLLGLA